jgi:CRISPR-associated protein Cas5t
MQVLKVELEGVTTSFRYPHFLVGRQPSLPMPPPATIYGHISSALGEWPDPTTLKFGYSFSCAGRSDDLESQHIVGASSGKFKDYPKNLEGNVNPAYRQVLLWPRLTLYLATEDLDRYYEHFRKPKYAVVLGRSQDLATYTSFEKITLVERDSGYFEGTILPSEYRNYTNVGVLTQMPRFINPENRREVAWEMYLVLEKVVHTSSDPAQTRSNSTVLAPSGQPRFLVDPTSPVKKDQQRIVWLHTFTDAA